MALFDLNSPIGGRYIRIVAVIALLLGLSDAARLLGVNSGGSSPLAEMGVRRPDRRGRRDPVGGGRMRIGAAEADG